MGKIRKGNCKGVGSLAIAFYVMGQQLTVVFVLFDNQCRESVFVE